MAGKTNGNGAEVLDAEIETETEGDDTGADDTASSQRAALEDLAREQGWRPKDEYLKLHNADPDKWVDAGQFIKNAEQRMPLVNAQNRKLQSDLREAKDLIRDVLKNQQAQQKAAVDRAIAALKADKKAAVTEGDSARVERIDDQIDVLRTVETVKTPEAKTEDQELAPEYGEWAGRNGWFKTDAVLRAEAIAALDIINVDPETTDLPLADKLKLVTRRVRSIRPEKFPAVRRPVANSVEGGGNAPRNGSAKKTWLDLPREAQDIGERLIRAKAVKDKAEYLANYAWG